MGTSVCKAVVQFYVNPLIDFDITNPKYHKHVPHYILRAFVSEDDYDGMPNPDLGNGWVHNPVKFNGDIYPDAWEKDGNRVWSINESPYSSGGGCSPAFFSDDLTSLEAFKKDFGITQDIQTNSAVAQFC